MTVCIIVHGHACNYKKLTVELYKLKFLVQLHSNKSSAIWGRQCHATASCQMKFLQQNVHLCPYNKVTPLASHDPPFLRALDSNSCCSFLVSGHSQFLPKKTAESTVRCIENMTVIPFAFNCEYFRLPVSV